MRIVFDGELNRLCDFGSGDIRGEGEGKVNAGGDAGTGDDAPRGDDALFGGLGAIGGEVVVRAPMGGGRQSIEQPCGAEQ
jgi:hypothetical protein